MVGPIEAGFAVAIGSQVLRALGFLHRNGVIHRDVSTDNIMMWPEARRDNRSSS